jgi:Curli production assembly/transport component CsgG
MRPTKSSSFALAFLLCQFLHVQPTRPQTAGAQPARRIAIIAGNGALEQAMPIYKIGENRLTLSLTGKLAGMPEIALIAQTDVDLLLRTQNFENSDRSSTETAAHIGKLLGASQIVLVNFTSGMQSQHREDSPVSTKVIATVQAEGNARLIDVETGAILAQPSCTFKEDAVALETKKWPVLKTTGEGVQATWTDLWTKATNQFTDELADKLTTALAQAPAPATADILVAGIANGSVLINKGTASGIKQGEEFQVLRMVSTGLTDPATNKPITQKRRVCVLTVTDAEDTSSSGSCVGGVPQRNDIAEPIQP